MKSVFTLAILLLFTLTATSQSISKQVVATSGNTLSNATHQLTSTVGEPIIGLKSTTVSINQGFLAGAATNSTFSVQDLVQDQSIKIFPNPVVDWVHFNIPNNRDNVLVIVYDASGKQVAQQPINATKQTLNLSHIASGMYVAQLFFKNTNTRKSFKIIKK